MKNLRKDPTVSDETLALLMIGIIFIDVLSALLIVKAPHPQSVISFFLVTVAYGILVGGANVLWVLFTLRKKK